MPIGNPDYQGFANQVSANLFPTFTSTFPLGFTILPVVPCGNWSSLNLIFLPSSGIGQVQIEHLADLAATESIGIDTWRTIPTGNTIVTSPLRGQFMRLRVNNTGVANYVAETQATFQTRPVTGLTYPVGSQHVAAAGQVIPAGNIAGFRLAFKCRGAGSVYFNPADATGKLVVSLVELNEDATTRYTFDNFGGPVAAINPQVSIPDGIVAIEINNTDLVNPHTCDFALVCPNV